MGDFFWSQFLTIYYGNLPEEAPWVLLRTMDPGRPYHLLAWTVLAGFFAIPFVTLLFRAVKWVPKRLALVAAIIVLAMILERFLCVAPPLLALPAGSGIEALLLPLLLAIGACAGILCLGGFFLLCLAQRLGAIAWSDPLLVDSLKDDEERPR